MALFNSAAEFNTAVRPYGRACKPSSSLSAIPAGWLHELARRAVAEEFETPGSALALLWSACSATRSNPRPAAHQAKSLLAQP
jgi:hypothetical protein